MGFEKAANLADVPAGTIKEVQVGGKPVAIANVGGAYYAIDGTCLHRGGPLGQGVLEGAVVTCPWHGWQFDVTTGRAVMNPNAGVGCLKAEVRGDELYVDPASSTT